jgi:hypothetical protein
MTLHLADHLDAMKRVGWRIGRLAERAVLPAAIVSRYAWVPRELLDFVCEIELAASADDKAWLLSAGDYAGTSGSAFAWNEWELIGLDAAADDEQWKREVMEFWDRHFPILMSVKSGYAFFAVDRERHAVVVGEEPEFEEVSPLAASVTELLKMISGRSSRLERWL